MSIANRSAKITKLFGLLKKRYKQQPAPAGRNLFETFLYACLLEDGSQDAADEGIAKLEQDYFDWNEVRVTTISELAESFKRLPNPVESASRLKKNLHSLFETYYSFDIEELRKQNLGKTVADFGQFPAMTSFVLAYIVQHGLGGHAIPVNAIDMDLLYYCGIVSESERREGKIPGIERAIPKAKGQEFASLMHQMSLEFAAHPKDPELRALIIKLNPAAEEMLPGKKSAKKKAPAKKAPAKKATKATAKATKATKKTKAATKKAPAKKAPSTKKSPAKSKAAKKKATKTAAKKGTKKTTKSGRSATKKLAKKKPR